MDHDMRSPLRKRLAQALATTPQNLSSNAICPPPAIPDPEEDERCLREWVLRHHTRLGLDPVWILAGIDRRSADAPRPARPLTPIYAMSAINPQTGAWQPQVVDRLALGPELVGPGEFVIRMEDRSMEPRIHPGAYLIVDPKQTELPDPSEMPRPLQDDAPIFAVDVPGEGLAARIARMEQPSHRIVLAALGLEGQPRILSPNAAPHPVKGRVVRLVQHL